MDEWVEKLKGNGREGKVEKGLNNGEEKREESYDVIMNTKYGFLPLKGL